MPRRTVYQVPGEEAGAVAAHEADTAAAHPASAVSFTPSGLIVATDVQAALAELDTEKAAVGHAHSGTYEPLFLTTYKASSAIAENISRYATPLGNSGVLTSGTLRLAAIALPAGATISAVSFTSSTTAGASLTNQWAALFTANRAMVAISADGTSGAWSANTVKTFTFTTPYVTLTSGLHYVGLMVAASTVPTMFALTTLASGAAPVLNGNSDTGLTTPPAIPFTAAAITASGVVPYVYVA